LRALAGLGLLAAVSFAWGQAPPPPSAPLPPETLPSEKPLPPPQFREPPPEILELPPLPPPETGRIPFTPRVVVRKFRITGNTVVSDAELAKIAAPYENRPINSTELEELRRQLTLYYVNHGYVNSGAVIPDQTINDGIIDIRIVEGRLTGIDIEGTQHFRKSYFSDRIALHAGPPLNLVNLQEGLQILLRDPLVAGINAELAPGARPGEAVLRARVAEAPPYDLGVTLDNKLSPSLGEAALTMFGEARNLIGYGDVFSGAFGFAEGIPYDVKLRYRSPLNARDTTGALYYEKAKAKVVQAPFDELDITSTVETLGAQVSHPVYRRANDQFALSAALEKRESQTTLLDEPFSFSPGVENGKAVVSVLRLGQDFLHRGRDQVLALRSTFSFGLSAFGSTVHSDAPDSRFRTWLGQAQFVQRLAERGDQLHLRFNFQLSNDSLLPLEKFSVGGLDSVRGFRTNQLVRDEGYTASAEYRRPLFANATGWRNIQAAVFIDRGWAKDKLEPNPSPSGLTGYGLGLIWTPSARYFAEVYVAGRTKAPEQTGHSLQDDSIYFRFGVFPFRPG
jgi:hemolysin activation/secretion protein